MINKKQSRKKQFEKRKIVFRGGDMSARAVYDTIPLINRAKFHNYSPPCLRPEHPSKCTVGDSVWEAKGVLNKYPTGKNPDSIFTSSQERYFMLYWAFDRPGSEYFKAEETGLTLKYFGDDVLKGTLTNIKNASQDENKKHRFRITGMKDGQECELICITFQFRNGRRYADDYKAQRWVDTINSELKKGPPEQRQPEPANRFGGVKSRLNIRRKNKTRSKKTQNKKKNRKNKNKQSKRQRR